MTTKNSDMAVAILAKCSIRSPPSDGNSVWKVETRRAPRLAGRSAATTLKEGVVRKINGCAEGMPWGEHCTMYPSKGGTPVVTYIHSGGHLLPDEVLPVIVKFSKRFAKP